MIEESLDEDCSDTGLIATAVSNFSTSMVSTKAMEWILEEEEAGLNNTPILTLFSFKSMTTKLAKPTKVHMMITTIVMKITIFFSIAAAFSLAIPLQFFAKSERITFVSVANCNSCSSVADNDRLNTNVDPSEVYDWTRQLSFGWKDSPLSVEITQRGRMLKSGQVNSTETEELPGQSI